MTYETFKKELLCAMHRQMGKEVQISIEPIPKNNGVIKEGMVIRTADSPVSPALFLQDIYYQLKDSPFSYDELASRLLKIGVAEKEKLEEQVEGYMDFYRAREHIFAHVINAGWNKSRLELLPHEKVLDLAVVCSYRIDGGPTGSAMVLIDQSQTENWGITSSQLLAMAKANTARQYPVSLISINDMIRMVADEEDIHIVPDDFGEGVPMFILTNTEKYLGAYSLFYPNVQQHVSDVLNSSYYVLPSSIHETILVPDSGMYTPKELQDMVKCVNRTQVDPKETLSDCVYFYDRKKRTLSIAADDK